MKKWTVLWAILCLTALLAACGGAASSAAGTSQTSAGIQDSSADAQGQSGGDSSAAEAPQETVYRGEVTEWDGENLTVTQLEGYDYGQASIVFHIGEETVMEDSGLELNVGAFVEVKYNGVLTRSLPPQGTADSLTIISAFSGGVIQNGVIQNVESNEEGYTITMLPFGSENDDYTSHVILNVPQGALENMTEADLVVGGEISAVTRGVAALSLPPQMPVYALLPYSPAA